MWWEVARIAGLIWLCLAGLAILVVIENEIIPALVRRRRRAQPVQSTPPALEYSLESEQRLDIAEALAPPQPQQMPAGAADTAATAPAPN